MGICESVKDQGVKNTYQKKGEKEMINNDSTNITTKNNDKNKKSSKLKWNSPSYILSEKLAKRDDITKYYNLSEQILGEGASGQVCIGENSKGKFAIKRIKKDKIKESEIQDIVSEAEISFHLNHKNIMSYYEIYEDLQYISYVMDLGEGGDLFDFITGCPLGHLPADIVIDLLIQILEVVDYLHSVKGIVHRDLKPENFMIKIDKQNNPTLKLIDFGLAAYLPQNGQKLKDFLGTREYAAPEIFEGTGYREKVDEWAIGIVMFNMLTGYDPFKGKTHQEIKNSVLFSDIKFDFIEDNDLRELNKKLLNRYAAKRITAKEALEEVIKIKKEREDYYNNEESSKASIKKKKEETLTYKNYWDNILSKINLNLT